MLLASLLVENASSNCFENSEIARRACSVALIKHVLPRLGNLYVATFHLKYWLLSSNCNDLTRFVGVLSSLVVVKGLALNVKC